MGPIAVWHTEHVYFSQLLRLLRREVDLFHRAETPNYELIQEIVRYLRSYTDRYHHPREDVAFARLAQRCPDLETAVARLTQEHRVIAHAGEKLLEMVGAVLAGAVVQRAELEVAAATYLVYYGNHIAKEEEDVLPRAAKALTEEDWAAVRDAVRPEADPLFGGGGDGDYRELRREIARS